MKRLEAWAPLLAPLLALLLTCAAAQSQAQNQAQNQAQSQAQSQTPQSCAERARALRLKQDHGGAAQQARACLARDEADVEAQGELSRALGLMGEHDKALLWVDKVLALHPEDRDMRAWRVRLLAWGGDPQGAYQEAARTLEDTASLIQRGDAETARLLGDLALWSEHHKEAVARFGLVLERWPEDHRARLGRARAWEAQGELALARSDYRQLCKEGDQGACSWVEREARRELTLRYRMRTSWIALGQDRPDWSQVDLGFEGLLQQRLRLGLETRWLRRDFGQGSLHDFYFEGQAGWEDPSGLFVRGSVGGTPAAAFYPELVAAVEPGVVIKPWSLELSTRVWRMNFDQSGATVLSPGAVLYQGPLVLALRGYAGVDDDGVWSGSGIARAGWTVAEAFHLWGGVGGGSRTDYIQLVRAQDVSGFGLLLAGASWQVTWRHHLRLDYLLRLEQAGGSALQLHQLSLGYVTTL